MTGKLAEKIDEGNLTAIIFYLKTQGGGTWKETNKTELTDADGRPIETKSETEHALTPELASAIAKALENEF